MAFHAQNDRIWITDTDGSLVFDTERDIPHILGVWEGQVEYDFAYKYYDESYQTLVALPDDVNFVLCRASFSSYNLATGEWNVGSYETFPRVGNLPWNSIRDTDYVFFQGSTLLEQGCTAMWVDGENNTVMSGTRIAVYANRALHVVPKPEWGNNLYAFFQQSVKTGWGAVSDAARVRWYANLKVWYGRFR